MINFVVLLIINSLMIVGIHLSTREHEINHWVDDLLGNSPDWIKKPLYDCCTCMASVHSTYVYWYVTENDLQAWITYLPYIFALSALSTIIIRIIEMCKNLSELKQDGKDKT